MFSIAPWLLVALAADAQELQPPELIRCPDVPYPEDQTDDQRVELLLQIDGSGHVRSVETTSGNPPFLVLAREAVWTCQFSPAVQDGQPTAVEIPFTWDFSLPPIAIQGTVRAAGVRKPVAGVSLRIGDQTTVTDALGHFAVRGLPPGVYPVTVAGGRWRMTEQSVQLGADEQVSIDVWIVEQGQLAGDELVATYDPRQTGGVTRSIRSDEIRATPGSLGDPLRALHNRPGFVRTPFDAGWLLVRGGDFDDTGTYVDGVRVPILYHIGGFTSVLHPEMTETVRFWPGVHPVRYQATSGAVDAIPKDIGDVPRATGGLNTVYAHAFVAVPTKFGGVAVAARRSYLDALLSVILDPERAAIAPRFWDGQARVEIGETSILALGLVDTFEAPTTDTNDTVIIQQDGLQLQAHVPIRLGRSELVLSPWVASQSKRLVGDVEKQAIFEIYPGLRAELTGPSDAPMRWITGIEAQHRAFRLTQGLAQLTTPVETIDPYISMSTGKAVVLETGIRIETFLVQDHLPRIAPSPRATVRWQATQDFAVNTGFSRVHGPPIATILFALPDGIYLDLEQADAVSLGFKATYQTITVDVDAFHRDLANITAFEADGSVGQLTGTADGIETEVHWRFGELEATALYQFTSSRRQEDMDLPTFPAVTDQPHRADFLLIDHLPKNWIVAGRFRYSSGFPRGPDPILGLDLGPQEAFDILTQRVRPVAVSDTALRLRPFHAMDVKVSKRFTFQNWQLDATLDLQNVYNRRVAEPFITGFGETIPTYGFGLPILPIFGVEGLFYPSVRQRRDRPTSSR